MLDQWLTWQPLDPCPYGKFSVIHVDQLADLQLPVREHLVDLIIQAKLSSSFLIRMQKRLSWDAIRTQLIAQTVPTQARAKRGEFGEILVSAVLQRFAGYSIPVPKLWFKLTSGQSLPATDALAIKVDNTGNIVEVCYVESKLRIPTDNSAAVQAAKQLTDDTAVLIPDILRFVANMLDLKGSPLADPFADYLADRADTRDKETYCIGLCWERSSWNDRVLSNLDEDDCHLNRLSVSVIRIDQLETLTDELFRAIGITEIEDDD